MAQTGGEIAAKRPKPSDDGADEDRLSALPDDVLVLILLRLDGAAAAIRTSILSRRWRRVWTLLPELSFELVPDGHRIREILDAPGAPELRCISVTTKGAGGGPGSAAAWLPVAARRLSGELVYHNEMDGRDDEDDMGRGDIQLPCFKNATTIGLDIGFLGLALPSQGIFVGLTELFLRHVRFRSPSELGGVVSSPRCPCLKTLMVFNSRGLQNLSIHSESLLQLKLKKLHRLRHLTIVAPILQELVVINCIIVRASSEVANISAPQLVFLDWRDIYDPRYVHLGNLGKLKQLTAIHCAYGKHRYRNSLMILQRFQAASLYSLRLLLGYPQDIGGPNRYLMGDIKVLPRITSLFLAVGNEGHAYHAFGASSFHLLRMCTRIRFLYLLIACPSPQLEVKLCLFAQVTMKTEKKTLHLRLLAQFGLIFKLTFPSLVVILTLLLLYQVVVL